MRNLLNRIIEFFRPTYKVVKYKKRWFIQKTDFLGGTQTFKKTKDKWENWDLSHARSHGNLYAFKNKREAKRHLKRYLGGEKTEGYAEEEETYTKSELLKSDSQKSSESILKR